MIDFITKGRINRWLCDSSSKLSFTFKIGSKALGSDLQTRIPITALLLAGISSGKVRISGEYNPMQYIGGLLIYIEKLGIIKSDDFENFFTQKRLEKIYLHGWPLFK